jgi:thiosulfate dehydrogenase
MIKRRRIMKSMKLISGVITAAVVVFFASMSYAAGLGLPLEKSVEAGKALFIHGTFDGNGRTCETCHTSGGTVPGKMPGAITIPSLNNAAAIYPRFNPRANKVITLEDQIRNCIVGALHGKPPDYGSIRMNALVSYITSLSRGKPMDMGGKPQ